MKLILLTHIGMAITLSACAAPQLKPSHQDATTYSGQVNSQLVHAVGDPNQYRLLANEVFIYPDSIDTEPPTLPASRLSKNLEKTILCVRIAITEQGNVSHVEPAYGVAPCQSGFRTELEDIEQLALARTREWMFFSPGICTYPDKQTPPYTQSEFRCREKGGSYRTAPVTLTYAFSFEVREGKQTVDTLTTEARSAE